MKLAEGIRKHGFRKWYERELLQCHAHLLLTFCCLVGVFAALEGMRSSASRADQAFDLFTLLLCAGAGLWALRRYLFLLMHAEATAHQADCPQCKVYGRFTLVGENHGNHEVEVRCRACGKQWRIEP